MEDLAGFGSWAALKLGFDVPWKVGAVVLPEDDIIAQSVHVFGVEEQAIHVKEASADRSEAAAW